MKTVNIIRGRSQCSKHTCGDTILQNIKKSRAIVGKGNISASEFIKKDRNSH